MAHNTSLTDKQRRFVEAYLENGRNGAAAYRAAYNAHATPQRAAEQASILLTHSKIAPVVGAAEAKADEATARVVDDYALSRERMVRELVASGHSNMRDYTGPGSPLPMIDLSHMTPEQTAAIAEIAVEYYPGGRGEEAPRIKRVRLKLHDKLTALRDLLRANGWDKPPVEPNAAERKVSLLELILESYEPPALTPP